MDFGLPASCTLGGTGKGIHTEGGREGYRRVREAQKVSFPGPVVQLAGSRRSEQRCEVPHDGHLFAEADKQVGNARVCASLLHALTVCTCLRAPGKNHLSMTRGE